MEISAEDKTTVDEEKLFLDCYYRLLQCKKNKDLCNSLPILRELMVQSDYHGAKLKLSQLSTANLKAELVLEYSNINDQIEHEGLLPIQSVEFHEQISSAKTNQDVRESLKKFQTHFNQLKIANVVCVPSITVPTKESRVYFPVSAETNKRFPVMKSTPCQNNLLKRLPASDNHNGPVSKRVPGKAMFGNRAYVQPNVRSNASSKVDNTTFMSAKSMYRNPLKEACNLTNVNEQSEGSNIEGGDSEIRNHETLKHFDKKIVDVILNEIMDFSPNIKWSDIAGLDFVKTTVQEIVIWPLLRPDIFTGLRAPPRGILLFGPPGTGKTLIGKCIATESNSTFFCISASSLASKWVGESEQLVRALFAAARLNQPAVIFIDEIDSLLSQRSSGDQDFTRKLKTEFLVQFDGAKTNTEERVLVVGATNRPHELDEAARRRFVKRLYVPLPEAAARRQIVQKLLSAHQHELSEEDMQIICDETKGYSSSDVSHLCKEAAMGPIRCIGPESIKTVSLDKVRPINLTDFSSALRQVRASVAQDDLNYYMEWNKKFGSFDIKI